MSNFDLSNITEALQPVRTEYWRDVRSIAGEIRDAIAKGERESDDAEDLIHESVDGNWWVIYTYAAQAVLMVSDNGGAIDDVSPETAFVHGQVNWSAMAYYAMTQDVREQLEAEMADANASST